MHVIRGASEIPLLHWPTAPEWRLGLQTSCVVVPEEDIGARCGNVTGGRGNAKG